MILEGLICTLVGGFNISLYMYFSINSNQISKTKKVNQEIERKKKIDNENI